MKDETRITVYWWDAACHSDLVGTKEELKLMTGIAVNTEGWLIRYDNDGIVLAAERLSDGDGPRFRGVTYIPRDMIREVWIVERIKQITKK